MLLYRYNHSLIAPRMSYRLGAVALVLALCAVSVHSQVWGYVSQSFSLVRSDNLEVAPYEMIANVTARDGGPVVSD